MSVEANLKVVERFFQEMLDQGKTEIEPELFTEDAVRHAPGGISHSGYGTSRRPERPHLSFRTTIHELFGADDRVAARITHYVTYGGVVTSFTRMGRVPAEGKSVSWDANVIFHFRDGRICEEWISRDELGVMLQLGAVQPLTAARD